MAHQTGCKPHQTECKPYSARHIRRTARRQTARRPCQTGQTQRKPQRLHHDTVCRASPCPHHDTARRTSPRPIQPRNHTSSKKAQPTRITTSSTSTLRTSRVATPVGRAPRYAILTPACPRAAKARCSWHATATPAYQPAIKTSTVSWTRLPPAPFRCAAFTPISARAPASDDLPTIG